MTLEVVLHGVDITFEYPGIKEKNQCRLDFKHNEHILFILTQMER